VEAKLEYLVLDIGERGYSIMKKKTDINKPIGKMTRIDDFLPTPEELAIPEKRVKVTISLSESSVNFFKREAKKYHTKYQKMIRNLLDKYAMQHFH